ncbi:MAG: aromatic amino acid transporter [Desulfovibrionaceae bacterium]
MSLIPNKPTVLGGTMIIAGTTIGAGMLALPTISAGMWFYWSLAIMLGTWLLMLLSSQALLEVNLHYEPGASFHTLVQDTLGTTWSWINGLAVAFVLYILVYAYVSGGGSIVRHSLLAIAGIEPGTFVSGLIFALLLTACVWWSTWIVDRFSLIMMAGMVITFVLSMTGLLAQIRAAVLLDLGGDGGQILFIWVALSTYLTSFCFHASVPSMVKYFGKDPKSINKCLIYGTLIALICYLTWILAADGSISRAQFKDVIAAGGNVGDLVKAAGANVDSNFILRMLEAFSALAVATSFLGAGLGLFDYIADLFGFSDSRIGRTKTALITFAPSTVCALIWPNGFLLAIGWAGLAASVWSVIVPALMLRVSRRKFATSLYTAPGGSMVIPLLLLYGCITAFCHTLVVFNVLPMYK